MKVSEWKLGFPYERRLVYRSWSHDTIDDGVYTCVPIRGYRAFVWTSYSEPECFYSIIKSDGKSILELFDECDARAIEERNPLLTASLIHNWVSEIKEENGATSRSRSRRNSHPKELTPEGAVGP